MTVNIIHEFQAAMQRTNWTPSLVATGMHVTKAAVSNWITRGDIPTDKLPALAVLLDDYDFRSACAEYQYGVRVHSEAHVVDTPEARYFRSAKEEADRKQLDPGFVLLLGKPENERTREDRKRVLAYCKELDEEIETKVGFKAAVMRSWHLSIDEEVS
jgi:hypothetical protein